MIGLSAGTINLGYYNRAFQLLATPISRLASPLAEVAVPTLRRVQVEGRDLLTSSAASIACTIHARVLHYCNVRHDERFGRMAPAMASDAYVVGSDQVWRPHPAIDSRMLAFLPTSDRAIRMAYGVIRSGSADSVGSRAAFCRPCTCSSLSRGVDKGGFRSFVLP